MKKISFVSVILGTVILTSCSSHHMAQQATIPMPKVKIIKADKPTNELEQAILDRHNYYRKIAGIKPLVWNHGIAINAYQWAKKLQSQHCEMKHSSNDFRSNKAGFNYLGENLHLLYSSAPVSISKKNIEGAADGWYGEIANYQYSRKNDFEYCPKRNTVSHGQIGHFTQLMWENSQALGCAAVQCDSNTKLLVVCQYGEGGNYVGEKPFSEQARQRLNQAEINKDIGGLPTCD